MTGREETCCLKGTRFVAIMLAALTLGSMLSATSCSYLRGSAGTSICGSDRRSRAGFTPRSARSGLLISIAAIVVSLIILAYFVREHGRPGFAFRACRGSFCLLRAFVLWWVLVYPANFELATWVNGPVPADWTKYRAQWEWGHATIVVAELLGFAALIWSVLADTPRWQPTPQRGR